MRFSHVVLDLDGTLVDTTASQTVALNEVLSGHQRDNLDATTVRRIAGSGLRAMLREALHLTGDPLTDAEISACLTKLRQLYARHLLKLTIAAPGLARTMRELHEAGVALSVLTNKPQNTAIELLDHVNITDSVAFLVAGDMGYARKPDPSGLLELMRSVQSDPGNTLLCGSMRIDLQTARNAGVRCAACCPFIDPVEVISLGADYMLHDLEQLHPLALGRRKSDRFKA